MGRRTQKQNQNGIRSAKLDAEAARVAAYMERVRGVDPLGLEQAAAAPIDGADGPTAPAAIAEPTPSSTAAPNQPSNYAIVRQWQPRRERDARASEAVAAVFNFINTKRIEFGYPSREGRLFPRPYIVIVGNTALRTSVSAANEKGMDVNNEDVRSAIINGLPGTKAYEKPATLNRFKITTSSQSKHSLLIAQVRVPHVGAERTRAEELLIAQTGSPQTPSQGIGFRLPVAVFSEIREPHVLALNESLAGLERDFLPTITGSPLVFNLDAVGRVASS